METDRRKWDAIHARASSPAVAPSWVEQVADLLPARGKALDVACGRGRVALWLARRGLRTLGVDISPVALQHAAAQASAQALQLETLCLDLERQPLPAGPFACIACFHYLQRDLFGPLIERLSPGGVLLAELPTRDNLQRHAHPSARFLLEPGELPHLLAALSIVHYEEGWFDDHALARCVAKASPTRPAR